MATIKTDVGYMIALHVTEKANFMDLTVTKMSDPNTLFITPPILLAAMTAAAKALRDAWTGGDTATINAAVIATNKLLRKQAIYIDLIADGDPLKIAAAGFMPTTGIKVPAVILGKTENVKLTAGKQAGSIKMMYDKLIGSTIHANIITTSPNLPIVTNGDYIIITIGTDKVIIDISGKRVRTYNGLPSMAKAYIKTIGYNSAGKGADSDMHDITVP